MLALSLEVVHLRLFVSTMKIFLMSFPGGSLGTLIWWLASWPKVGWLELDDLYVPSKLIHSVLVKDCQKLGSSQFGTRQAAEK